MTGPVTLGTSYNILTNSAPTTNVISVGVNADATQDPTGGQGNNGSTGQGFNTDVLRISGVVNYGSA